MLIVKYYVSDLEIFRVIQSTAIEAFYEYFLSVVPNRERVRNSQNGDPLFFGMESEKFDFIWKVHVKIENYFILCSHKINQTIL